MVLHTPSGACQKRRTYGFASPNDTRNLELYLRISSKQMKQVSFNETHVLHAEYDVLMRQFQWQWLMAHVVSEVDVYFQLKYPLLCSPVYHFQVYCTFPPIHVNILYGWLLLRPYTGPDSASLLGQTQQTIHQRPVNQSPYYFKWQYTLCTD